MTITMSAEAALLSVYNKIRLTVPQQRIKGIYRYDNRGVASYNVLYSHSDLILL
jgi:hypothetical protein